MWRCVCRWGNKWHDWQIRVTSPWDTCPRRQCPITHDNPWVKRKEQCNKHCLWSTMPWSHCQLPTQPLPVGTPVCTRRKPYSTHTSTSRTNCPVVTTFHYAVIFYTAPIQLCPCTHLSTMPRDFWKTKFLKQDSDEYGPYLSQWWFSTKIFFFNVGFSQAARRYQLSGSTFTLTGETQK